MTLIKLKYFQHYLDDAKSHATKIFKDLKTPKNVHVFCENTFCKVIMLISKRSYTANGSPIVEHS